MVDKPLGFKEWLKECYAIDYDRWESEMTDATHKVWREGYEWYLKEWKDNKKLKSEEIEILIGKWEELANDYRHQAGKFINIGYELAGGEFLTIANTLDRCANDLKKNAHK